LPFFIYKYVLYLNIILIKNNFFISFNLKKMIKKKNFENRPGYIWLDGKFVRWNKAKIHVLTHGLHYASCVFEGARIYKGKIFKLKEHTKRLFFSSKILGFKLPYTEKTINKACEQIIKKQNIKNGYLRPFAWRGSEMMAISAQNTTIHVAIATWEMTTYFDKRKKFNGIKLQTSKWMRPQSNTAPTQAKAAGLYMICTLSKHIAEEKGFDDSLMLDSNGYVAESTGANIFFVKNNKLYTPVADCFLNGITRQIVIQLAKKNNIKVIEKRILPKELSKADEIFLTGTAVEITPVSQIDNKKFKVGEITQKLVSLFSNLIESKY
jgi:branched-chain amino acid aminotransferase